MTIVSRRTSVGLIGAALTAFAIQPAAAAETFKIGLIASYTGAFASWGPQFQNAIEAYQAIHGKTVKGPKGEEINVEIVTRDAGSAGPDKAKQLAEELVLRERVKMLAGFELSPHAMAVGQIANDAKVPVVIMNAATSSITRGSPYYVRTSSTIPQWSASMAKWASENGIKKVYTIVSDYAPGHDAEVYFQKVFKENGGEIVGATRTPIRETNFAVYMEKVLQTKPDAVYMFQPGGSPSIAFVRAFMERGLKQAGIKLLGGGEFAELYLPNFTDDVIGVVSVNHYTETNKLPENIQMRDQLKKMFGDKGVTDIASVGAWDGINLIYAALREVGASADGLKYVEAMKGKRLKSPRGEIMIDPVERDIIQNIYIRRIEKVDGRLTNVDIATIPMVKDPWKIDNPVKK
ncbi:MAG TPA: ABC transporter substrate-binding protein [Xanthobacteraceae bacterium]|nr:ABC transporter substrate-binding protein [Xanthobacteraceae bacterium]